MRIALLVLALTCALSRSSAANPSPAQQQRAREHFERGKDLYSRAYYEAAALEYRAAYRLIPLPELLFNIGQAFRLGKKDADAIRAYEMYIAAAPSGDLADEARLRVQELRAQAPGERTATSPIVDDAPELETREQPVVTTDRPPDPRRRRWAFGLDMTQNYITSDLSFTTLSATVKSVHPLSSWAAFEPRVLTGISFGGDESPVDHFNASLSMEAQARLMFYPGTPWLFFGPGFGVGVSTCATSIHGGDGCHVGSTRSLYLEVGVIVADHYELSLAWHPVSFATKVDETPGIDAQEYVPFSPFSFSAAYRL